ncbi:MAG: hypothetical protein V2A78_06480 [bacterium]
MSGFKRKGLMMQKTRQYTAADKVTRRFIFFLLLFLFIAIFFSNSYVKDCLCKERNSAPINTLIVLADGRVVEVTIDKKIIWEYSFKPITQKLTLPAQKFTIANESVPLIFRAPIGSAIRLTNGNTLIAETQNHRVIEVNHGGKIVWQYGINGQFGNITDYLYRPKGAFPTKDGNVLIFDKGDHRIIEVDRKKEIIWEFDAKIPPGGKFKLPAQYLQWIKHLKDAGPEFSELNYENLVYLMDWVVPLENGNILRIVLDKGSCAGFLEF